MSAFLRIVAGGLLAALVAVSVLLTAPTAKAHMLKCGERRDFIDQLEKQYDEKRAILGLRSNGHLIEVFVGPSGSWTILTSDPAGIACLLDSGEGWQPVATPQDEPVA